MTESKQSKTAVILCLMMLFCCLGTLAVYLFFSSPAMNEAAVGDQLGMVLIDIPDKEAASFYHVNQLGVYVLAVDENSHAYERGVRSGDRMVSVNGAPIMNTNDFSSVQDGINTGQVMEITFHRDAENNTLVAAFGQETGAE